MIVGWGVEPMLAPPHRYLRAIFLLVFAHDELELSSRHFRQRQLMFIGSRFRANIPLGLLICSSQFHLRYHRQEGIGDLVLIGLHWIAHILLLGNHRGDH